MLDRLVESRATKSRAQSQLAASVALHTLLIGAAVYATGQAQARVEDEPATKVAWRAPYRQTVSRGDPRPQAARPVVTPGWIEPRISIDVPDIDLGPIGVAPIVDGEFSGLERLDATSRVVGPNSGSGVFRGEQVEKPASVAPGASPPVYPETLRQRGIQGGVTAHFVVDATGRVELETLRFLRSDNTLFEDAVRSALTRMQFIPAEIAGQKVRQLVEMPFVFQLK